MKTLSRHCRAFLLSLGFLTRLAPARTADAEEMSRTCLYYPFCGALLGLILVFPPYLGLIRLGLGTPLVWAFLYVLAGVWLTRALHHDGLADVLDALGSGKSGPAFQTVLKDSRLGAFGTLGLALAVAGQIILAAACLEQGRLAPLFCAPLLGRCLPVFLPLLAPVHPASFLGSILARARRLPCLCPALAAALLAAPLCLGLPAAFAALALCLSGLLFLARLARREGGYNGDYLGALILCGELAALLAAALAPA